MGEMILPDIPTAETSLIFAWLTFLNYPCFKVGQKAPSYVAYLALVIACVFDLTGELKKNCFVFVNIGHLVYSGSTFKYEAKNYFELTSLRTCNFAG